MKQTMLKIKQICFITIIAIIVMDSSVFAQGNNFKLTGNNNLKDSTTFIGSTNAKDFVVKTNSQERLRVDKFGKTTFKKSIVVQDSMQVFGRLKIGTGSLILDPASSTTGTYNSIFTDDWDLLIQCEPSYNFNTIFNASGQTGNVGIGTETPGFKLEVNNDINLTSSVHNHGYRIGGDVVLQNSGSRKKICFA